MRWKVVLHLTDKIHLYLENVKWTEDIFSVVDNWNYSYIC